ncbi:hypothetical protein [Neorhodopirellula lusitana]|uniref:hypothetical protein n=1 Tax=Neorhodopirellula lusitana TaxID=445327 RepID=UPI00384E930F
MAPIRRWHRSDRTVRWPGFWGHLTLPIWRDKIIAGIGEAAYKRSSTTLRQEGNAGVPNSGSAQDRDEKIEAQMKVFRKYGDGVGSRKAGVAW